MLAVGREEFAETAADEGPVVVLGKGVVKTFEADKARFESGFGTVSGAAAPILVLAEERGLFFERVGGRRVEDGGGGPGVERGRQEPVEVEEIGFVRLARGPEARVGEEPGDEIDDRVAEGVADPGRIVAGAPEIGIFPGPMVRQALPVPPDALERGPGLRVDLVPRPGLEVDGACGLDALALVDLPGIGFVIGREGLGEEKVQHVAVDGGLRPGLLFEEADGGLVAVEAGAKLDFLDQGPGPERFVTGAPGLVAEARGLFGGLFEFLLVDEPLDELAARFVSGPGLGLRAGGKERSGREKRRLARRGLIRGRRS